MFPISFARIFLISLLTTEFIYIDFFGGIVRPYHFLLAFVLLISIPRIAKLGTSPVFVSLMAVFLTSAFSAVVSDDPGSALKSLVLLCLNGGIALALAVLVNSGRLRMVTISKTIVQLTVLMVGIAAIQFMAFKLAGNLIAYSEGQSKQIAAGFAPSLFNEANGFAKYLVTPILLFIPWLVRRGAGTRIKMFYGLIILAFLANLMRAALFGIAVGLLVAMLWYIRIGLFSWFTKRVLGAIVASALIIVVATSFGFTIAEYNLYKLNVLFDLDAVETDGSWRHRAMAMELALEQTLVDPFRIVFGNGWGQVYAYMGEELVQVGGADLVNFFVYDGLLGVVAYLVMIGLALRAAARRARRAMDPYERNLAEGVFFALVGSVACAFVSPMILVASFWLLIGMTIVFDYANAREKAVRRFIPVRGRAVR